MPKKVSKARAGAAKKNAKPPFRVRRSRTGLGLFAVEPIKKGTFIIEYWGKRILCREADRLKTKYLFDLSSRWAIDGSDRRNIARYINHSCKPNAVAHTIRSQIRIYAKRMIQPGEEIAYNYGRDYFTMFIEPIGCKCEGCIARRKSRPRTRAGVKTATAAKRRASTARTSAAR